MPIHIEQQQLRNYTTYCEQSLIGKFDKVLRIQPSVLQIWHQTAYELGGKVRREDPKEAGKKEKKIKLTETDFKVLKDVGFGSYGVVSLIGLFGNKYALK